MGKVYRLDEARGRRICRRADGSLPAPASPLERALRAVAARGNAAFEAKVALFRRVFREAMQEQRGRARDE